jgi:hypothetical protein
MHEPLVAPTAAEIAPADRSIEVSVVMPCRNELRTVGRCVEKAWAARVDFSLFVVDN